MKFEDKHTAKHWMVKNQCSKRNLEPIQRIQLVLKYEEECAKKANENKVIAAENTNTLLSTLSKASDEQPYVHKEVHIQTTPKVVIVPINTRKECSAISNVSEGTFAKAKEVLQKAAPEVVAKLNAGEITINRAYTDIKREEKKIERQIDIVKNPVIPDGKFNVILADPPWRYEFSKDKADSIENHYPTMELSDIKKLNLPIDDNAVLFLWATAPKLQEALEVMSAWGFTYKTI